MPMFVDAHISSLGNLWSISKIKGMRLTNAHVHVYSIMNILIFTLQERQAPIMSDAARRKERELAQKEVSTNEKLHFNCSLIIVVVMLHHQIVTLQSVEYFEGNHLFCLNASWPIVPRVAG